MLQYDLFKIKQASKEYGSIFFKKISVSVVVSKMLFF